MRQLGLDIGSRAIKLALCEDGVWIDAAVVDTTWDPLGAAEALLAGREWDRLVVTGYGRRLLESRRPCEVITEIKAVSLGATHLHPEARAIVDIGGQDTKAVALDERGRMSKFSMNDRCAAGTGRFLEVMAAALALPPAQFVAAALGATRAEKLSSMCAVFAESEVVSLTARGADRGEVARGIHEAVVSRTLALLGSVPVEGPVLFTGGGALNACLADLIAAGLAQPLIVPERPQLVAALGCALAGSA
jgi:(R)-2-hydroxyacyl-CoA dehydratese activating ATPase